MPFIIWSGGHFYKSGPGCSWERWRTHWRCHVPSRYSVDRETIICHSVLFVWELRKRLLHQLSNQQAPARWRVRSGELGDRWAFQVEVWKAWVSSALKYMANPWPGSQAKTWFAPGLRSSPSPSPRGNLYPREPLKKSSQSFGLHYKWHLA